MINGDIQNEGIYTKNNDIPVLTISDVPSEILMHIFTFLDPDRHSVVTSINKKWNTVSSDNGVWMLISENMRFDIFPRPRDLPLKSHCKNIVIKQEDWRKRTAEEGSIRTIVKLAILEDFGPFDTFFPIWDVKQKYHLCIQILKALECKKRKNPEFKSTSLVFANIYLWSGSVYCNGTGVDQDYDKAIEYYQKAGEMGNGAAYFNLGVMYRNGMGVDRDYDKAIKYDQKAGEMGVGDAYYNLGIMYCNGTGVDQYYDKAIEYYQKAGEMGNGAAYYNLGVMYRNGMGVDRDYCKAIEYYQKAEKLLSKQD